MIDQKIISSILADSPNRWTIEYLASIDSTNLELERRITRSGNIPHFILWAEEQTAGKGRVNRTWRSVPNEDITASICFKSPVSPVDAPKLTICAGLALARVLREELGIDSLVRWPNDIITARGKLAGILMSYLTGSDFIICGIGINVNSESGAFDFGAERKHTSVRTECGREVSRENLLGKWVLAFESMWPLAMAGNFEKLDRAFNEISFYRNKKVRVLIGAAGSRDDGNASDEFTGVAQGLDKSGSLIVRKENGEFRMASTCDVIIPSI